MRAVVFSRKKIADTYKNIEGADISKELTAELVGEYLFTDEKFVKQLLVEHRNVFQKIYDEIKYLAKLVTAGSKEARALEAVKHTFEKVYREGTAQKNTVGDGEVRYSLNEFEDGQRFVIVDVDQELFDGLDLKGKIDLATKILKERFQGKVIGLENRAFVNGVTVDEYTHPAKHIENDLYEAKMRASTELDNLIDAGFDFRNEVDGKDGHIHPDTVAGFDYFDVIFKVGEDFYKGVINIKNNARGKLLKDITKIENITKDMTSRYGDNPSYAFLRDASMIIIPQSSEKVNPQNSLSPTDEDLAPVGDFATPANELRYEGDVSEDIAPVREDLTQGDGTSRAPSPTAESANDATGKSTKKDKLTRAYARIDRHLEADKAALKEEFDKRAHELENIYTIFICISRQNYDNTNPVKPHFV